MDLDPRQAAFAFLARLGSALVPQYRGRPGRAVHIPQVFEAPWITGMALPLAERRAPSQTVALVDGTEFHRETDEAAVARAYQERRRTRVYESIDALSDGWYSLVVPHLAKLLRVRVICTMYESHAADSSIGAHHDGWYGAIVQMRGAKHWTIWSDADSDPREVLTQAGDVLLLPKGVTHAVDTPDYSVHLVFAITEESIEISPG
ncbi:hypothetical protein [Peterkaempfera bronchialis]|uniref:hypothetical protein n=1 Tax=Peterkaempfera bronchialis TaxID=2126346 RepID=UPI003C2F8297